MVKKNCPYCKKDSYSTSTKGKWICPYCHKDISDVPANNPTAKLGNILVSLLQNYQCTDNQELEKALRKAFEEAGVPSDEVWIKLLLKFGSSICRVIDKDNAKYVMYEA